MRRGGTKLGKRLIGRIATLIRRGVDELSDLALEENRDLGFDLAARTELQADDIMRIGADRLERGLPNLHAAKITAIAKRLPQKCEDLGLVIFRIKIGSIGWVCDLSFEVQPDAASAIAASITATGATLRAARRARPIRVWLFTRTCSRHAGIG